MSNYTRPSVRDLILLATSIEQLAELRANLVVGLIHGDLAPSDKTRESWEKALWTRVLALMIDVPANAPYIANVVRRWPKPDPVAFAIDATMEAVCKLEPSPAERLRAEGIVIEGVT